MSTEIGIKERVNAIKVGSSAYNYYMNTPLSELKTRDEKLIKQELESRNLSLLSESDTTEEIDDTAETPEENEGMSTGTKVAIGAGAAVGSYAALIGYFTHWTGSLKLLMHPFTGENWAKAGSRFKEGFDNANTSITSLWQTLKGYITSAASTAYDYTLGPIVKYFNSFVETVTEQVNNLIGNGINNNQGIITKNGVSQAVDYTIAVAVIILGVYCIWKVVKYFIKSDGTAKSEEEVQAQMDNSEEISESLELNELTGKMSKVTEFGNPFLESFNPFYNNTALAILTEADEETSDADEGVQALDSGSKGFIVNTADKIIVNIFADSKLVANLQKNAPELLNAFEEYKNRDKSEDENLAESDMPELPNKDNNEVMPVEDNGSVENGSTTSLFDSIVNTFKKAGNVTADSLNYVKNKIIEFKRKFTDSPHTIVRWIPATVETALAALAIGYLWYTNKDQLAGFTAKNIGLAAGGLAAGGMAGYDAYKQLSSDNKSENKPSETEVEQEAFVINQYMNALNIISEAMDDMKKQNVSKININKVLDGFNGKSDKMSSQVIDRAKKVSVDLLNQDEFITFSKKYNPEVLTILKKASKLK